MYVCIIPRAHMRMFRTAHAYVPYGTVMRHYRCLIGAIGGEYYFFFFPKRQKDGDVIVPPHPVGRVVVSCVSLCLVVQQYCTNYKCTRWFTAVVFFISRRRVLRKSMSSCTILC